MAGIKVRLTLASAVGPGSSRATLLREAVEIGSATAAGIDPETGSPADLERIALLAAASENLGFALRPTESEARAAVEEAISRYRSLARRAPDPYQREPARVLTRSVVLFLGSGDLEAARTAGAEAVESARELVRRHGDGQRRWLGAALVNHSRVLAELRQDGAVAEALEAVHLYEPFAEPEYAADRQRALENADHIRRVTGRSVG